MTILHPRIDGVICVSEAVRKDVLSKVWFNKDNVVTIYKGHDINWYDPEPTQRSKLGIPEDALIGICVANSRPSKGVQVLLEAIKGVDAPNFHLVLVGNGMDEFKTLANNSGMGDRVHFLGFRTDISNLMAMSDFQIQPSISGEGLPKTIIEAMVVAKPSIVTTTGGSAELIKDRINGLVVHSGDTRSLSLAIQDFTSNKNRLPQMGLKSKDIMNREFSLNKSVKDHLTFFDKILN
ncbi:poly(glycerol-phosphate) alpha-glucosyltransferase [Vibrio ishigakensis]|uniref:Poly(Glycerol-phosphate) alpha-glucosyltransferase n=1 Tax=Vibrio ishigakensis TaxID=1481914 RepID=A0A0B8PGN4_9VIBR|nr:poly(glycerol-phosphate) alpha-glucosyltransferase [Vibrio ishigakensis]